MAPTVSTCNAAGEPDFRTSARPIATVHLVLLAALLLGGTTPAIAQENEIDYMPGRLSAAHEGLEDPDSCDSCHNDDLEVDGERCLVCHDQIAERINAKKGVHREVSFGDCAVCHAEHQGRDADLRSIDREDFNHDLETGFALQGFHGAFAGDCSTCHTTRSFLNLQPNCTTCHQDVHKNTLGDDCTTCHAVDTHFRNASRAFHKSALLPLEGRHLDVPCASCHVNGVIKGTPTRCADCHWIRRQDDPYRTRLGVDCESCHAPTGWIPAKWNHEANTGFPIGGQHLAVGCEGCHTDRRFDGPVAPDCYSCHREDYQEARDPDHVAAGFPTQCDVCHRPTDGSWNQAIFSHDYRLQGRHATLECAACHSGGIYAGTPRNCFACHQDDYFSSADPDHRAAGFPTTCTLCHGRADSSWHDADFDHTFQLAGTHATLNCASCHSSGVYAGTPTDCVGCHQSDYTSTIDPNHQAAGFSTDCDTCHQASDPDWFRASYPHSVWPLVGSHTAQRCSSCHTGAVYSGLPSECADCHLDDYNATTDPNHQSAGFPTTCETCHQPTTWTGADFNHPYSLVGAHATLDCSACHAGGVYAGTPTDCVGCHQSDYTSTIDPNHQAAGFSTDCDTCHQASDPDWFRASYPHSVWPLVGSHTAQRCSSCHTGAVYSGLPSECADCHLDDYNATTDPNHQSAGFPTTCETCHQPTTWTGADFNHPYSLVGAHATLDCSACHAGGVYAGTPTDCVGCHQSDYTSTIDPNHQAAGFSTDCDTCHQASDPDWFRASYPHSVWPLVGSHTAQRCSSCHTGAVYSGLPSECADCHLDDYNATTDPNHQSAGFPTTCETCHQPTTWTGADFNHPYSLVGAHATLDCSACHSGGVYAGTPTDCVGCHLADYNSANNPNHQAAGFPTDCELCHRQADLSWDQGTFDHTYFPINSGKHAGAQCDDCHTNPSNFRIFSCLDAGCHPRSDMDDKHSGETGYVYDSAACYSCHPDGRPPQDAFYRMRPSHG